MLSELSQCSKYNSLRYVYLLKNGNIFFLFDHENFGSGAH